MISMLTPSTLSDSASSNQRRAHQRLLVERGLIRFVVDEGLVPITALAPFLDLDETTALRSNLLHNDAVFPDDTRPHYSLLATIENHLAPRLRLDEVKTASLVGHLDLAVRGTKIARDLLQLVGDRLMLFEIVSEQSRDPQAIWDLAQSILDGFETVH